MKHLNQMMTLPFTIFLLFSACTKQKNESNNLLALKDINPKVSIGAPIDASYDNDKYKDIIKTEFNTGQSLWYARWKGWLYPGFYDFTDVSDNINWMRANGISPTVHMLVGPDNYMPDWLVKTNWQKSKLDSLLQDMIYKIMDTNDNKNKVDVWNVTNELFEDNGTYRTNMVWNKLGWEDDASTLTGEEKINVRHPVFIRKVLTYCREKTNKKLELRDFNIENNNPANNIYKKHRAMYQLLKHLLNENVPVDAVGIQGHLNLGNTDWILDNNGLKDAVARFKSLGIEVYIMELDVRTNNQTWTDDLAQKQKEDYYAYIKQAIEGGANMINIWGIQDGFDKSWIPTEHPLPWDENLEKKPAFEGIQQALSDTKNDR